VSLRLLNAAVGELPTNLRQRIIDYGSHVNQAAPEIFANVGVERPTRRQVDRLVLVAGLRKLWAMVEFQRNTINAVVGQRGFDMTGVISRGTLMTRTSDETQAVRETAEDLIRVLEETGMLHMVRLRTLSDVAQELQA
jgi:hypothetical protein